MPGSRGPGGILLRSGVEQRLNMRFWHNLVLAGTIALACSTGAWSRAEVFSEYSFEQAKHQALQDRKILLVDFTASWCPPCRRMESTTWVDIDVQAWIRENAIAVQVDVDKDKKVAAALKVEAMPTLILFTPQSGAAEFGRQVGFMDASELLQWLEGAKSGKPAGELEKEKAQIDSVNNSVFERISKARQMETSGRNAEALEEYIWIWNNTRKGGADVEAVRSQLVPFELNRLCKLFPAARTKLTEVRDAAEANERKDWIILNGILDDNARTLSWFDKAKQDPKQRDFITKQTPLLERILFNASRWADCANYLYANPIARINDYYKAAQEMKKPRDAHTEVSKDFDPFPPMVLLLYGSYVGAGRDQEAQKIADECLRLDDTADMRRGLENMAKGMQLARQSRAKAAR